MRWDTVFVQYTICLYVLFSLEINRGTPTCFPSLCGRRHYIAALLRADLSVSSHTTTSPSYPSSFTTSGCQPLPPAMASLTDLVNLNLSDTTEKIIAEYIWYGALSCCYAFLFLFFFSIRQSGSILLGCCSPLHGVSACENGVLTAVEWEGGIFRGFRGVLERTFGADLFPDPFSSSSAPAGAAVAVVVLLPPPPSSAPFPYPSDLYLINLPSPVEVTIGYFFLDKVQSVIFARLFSHEYLDYVCGYASREMEGYSSTTCSTSCVCPVWEDL